MKWLVAFIFLLVSVAPNVSAQDAMTEREKAAAAKAAALKARENAELRVEADMVTMNSLVEALSKNLGQLHYLRTICYGPSDQKWRDYASQMMNIDALLMRAITKKKAGIHNVQMLSELMLLLWPKMAVISPPCSAIHIGKDKL